MTDRGPLDFSGGLWQQAQKVRIDSDGTLHAPIKANGTDGIVFGDPAAFSGITDAAKTRKPSRLKALLQRIRSRRRA